MLNDGTRIISVDLEKEMKKSFMEYSMSVITSRLCRSAATDSNRSIEEFIYHV